MKKIHFLFLAIALLCIIPVFSLYAGSACDATHSKMAAWAEANPAPTLEEVQTLSMPEQRALVNYLSPEALAYLWNEKLEESLQIVPMTAEQESLLLQIKSFIVPAFFESNALGAELQKSAELVQNQIEEVFSKRDARVIFTQFSSDTISDNAFDSIDSSKHIGGETSRLVVIPDCTCNTGDDWCPSVQNCSSTRYPSPCKKSSGGCGWWFWKACDGTCWDRRY